LARQVAVMQRGDQAMKEYTVRYSIGAYIYESVVRTSSSDAALLWAEAMGGYRVTVVSWKEVE
jgi:hypothetical protein